jgi:long-chain acyl-CoA synthetase
MAPNDPTISWPLERAALVSRDDLATIDRGSGERFTWGQTKRRVDGISSALGAMNLDPGDRVGVLMLNSARHLELWFAIPRAGLIMNDLNYRLAPEELRFICDDSQVRVLFVDDNFLDIARALLTTSSTVESLVWVGPGPASPPDTVAYDTLADTDPIALPAADADDVAAIFYTGGTTGLPKGAMLTHRNLIANALHVSSHARLNQTDRYLHAGPQFHLADGTFTFAITWIGATHVFLPAFDPVETIAALSEDRITVALLIPAMISMVLASGGLADADTSALRLLLCGASPMPSQVQRQAIAEFDCGLAQAYGMTEASPLVSWLDEETHRRGSLGEEPFATRLRSAGVPLVGVKAEVRSPDGSIAPTGEPGEILVQGANVMKGYWNREQETADAFVDGWYRSGDIAYTDDSGYLFVVDRAKDMIISGGENIYTTEIENAVYSHPSVAEAAAFGIPDQEWGETVHVEVVLKPGATLANNELIDHCRKLIAGYKLPRSLAIRPPEEPLPKSGAGKILKTELRSPYWTESDRRIN